MPFALRKTREEDLASKAMLDLVAARGLTAGVQTYLLFDYIGALGALPQDDSALLHETD